MEASDILGVFETLDLWMIEKPRKREKVGGRKKGTPNKNTYAMKDYLEWKGFSVPEKLMELYQTTGDDILRYKILELMTEYCYPKPKVDIPDFEPEEIDVENMLEQFEHVSNETLSLIANREKKISE